MTTIKQAIQSTDDINQALIDAKNSLDVIYAPEPANPVVRVQDGDKRHEKICAIMLELGGALARTGYGHEVAKSLVTAVRVIRGERAETLYEPKYLRAKTVYVNGQPDHLEIECNEVERKRDYANE